MTKYTPNKPQEALQPIPQAYLVSRAILPPPRLPWGMQVWGRNAGVHCTLQHERPGRGAERVV